MTNFILNQTIYFFIISACCNNTKNNCDFLFLYLYSFVFLMLDGYSKAWCYYHQMLGNREPECALSGEAGSGRLYWAAPVPTHRQPSALWRPTIFRVTTRIFWTASLVERTLAWMTEKSWTFDVSASIAHRLFVEHEDPSYFCFIWVGKHVIYQYHSNLRLCDLYDYVAPQNR